MAILIYCQLSHLECSVVFKEKIKHLLEGSQNEKEPTGSDWLANCCCVIIWILSCSEEKANSSVMFLKTAKGI